MLNMSAPFFAYHTISDTDFGMHFKETDRPSLFCFDRRGMQAGQNFRP